MKTIVSIILSLITVSLASAQKLPFASSKIAVSGSTAVAVGPSGFHSYNLTSQSTVATFSPAPAIVPGAGSGPVQRHIKDAALSPSGKTVYASRTSPGNPGFDDLVVIPNTGIPIEPLSGFTLYSGKQGESVPRVVSHGTMLYALVSSGNGTLLYTWNLVNETNPTSIIRAYQLGGYSTDMAVTPDGLKLVILTQSDIQVHNTKSIGVNVLRYPLPASNTGLGKVAVDNLHVVVSYLNGGYLRALNLATGNWVSDQTNTITTVHAIAVKDSTIYASRPGTPGKPSHISIHQILPGSIQFIREVATPSYVTDIEVGANVYTNDSAEGLTVWTLGMIRVPPAITASPTLGPTTTSTSKPSPTPTTKIVTPACQTLDNIAVELGCD